MKVVYLGTIATSIVVILSVMAIFPAFTQRSVQPYVPIMLAFDINDEQNLPAWCNEVATSLQRHDMKGTVFIAGKIAEQYNECVTTFSSNKGMDLGSKTYSYVNLTLADYTQALEEVRRGKEAVDRVGQVNSVLFRAPHGLTDDNIYSILTRSGITADFSYDRQYNKYHENKFLYFNVTSYNGAGLEPDFLSKLESREPVIINFDNSVSNDTIDNFLDVVASSRGTHYDLAFVNASDLTQTQLTIRVRS